MNSLIRLLKSNDSVINFIINMDKKKKAAGMLFWSLINLSKKGRRVEEKEFRALYSSLNWRESLQKPRPLKPSNFFHFLFLLGIPYQHLFFHVFLFFSKFLFHYYPTFVSIIIVNKAKEFNTCLTHYFNNAMISQCNDSI